MPTLAVQLTIGDYAKWRPVFDKHKPLRDKAGFEIAPEPTGHGLPLGKCEAYNRVYDQSCGSS
jgi:hypothetical protein